MIETTIARKADVTGTYAALATGRLLFSGEISCPPTNAGNVLFKGDDGSDVPWVPGEWHTFVHVNLAGIEIKGTPGDIVTIVGGTW